MELMRNIRMQGVQMLSVFMTVLSLLAFSFAFVFKLVGSCSQIFEYSQKLWHLYYAFGLLRARQDVLNLSQY